MQHKALNSMHEILFTFNFLYHIYTIINAFFEVINRLNDIELYDFSTNDI